MHLISHPAKPGGNWSKGEVRPRLLYIWCRQLYLPSHNKGNRSSLYSPNTDLLLVKSLPLHSVTESPQVLSEGCAAVGDGQVGEQLVEGDGVGVLVKQRPYDRHQVGESLWAFVLHVVHYPSRPQVGAQLPQQEAHLLPAQAQHSLEKAVELQVGHLRHLRRCKGLITSCATTSRSQNRETCFLLLESSKKSLLVVRKISDHNINDNSTKFFSSNFKVCCWANSIFWGFLTVQFYEQLRFIVGKLNAKYRCN